MESTSNKSSTFIWIGPHFVYVESVGVMKELISGSRSIVLVKLQFGIDASNMKVQWIDGNCELAFTNVSIMWIKICIVCQCG